jgi:hypothetical protein
MKLDDSYRMRNTPALILNQINPLRALPSHFFEICVNFILQIRPKCWKFRFPSRFPTRILHQFVFSTVLSHVAFPSCPPRFDCPKRMWWGTQIKKLLIIQFYYPFCYFLILRLTYLTEHILEHLLM